MRFLIFGLIFGFLFFSSSAFAYSDFTGHITPSDWNDIVAWDTDTGLRRGWDNASYVTTSPTYAHIYQDKLTGMIIWAVLGQENETEWFFCAVEFYGADYSAPTYTHDYHYYELYPEALDALDLTDWDSDGVSDYDEIIARIYVWPDAPLGEMDHVNMTLLDIEEHIHTIIEQITLVITAVLAVVAGLGFLAGASQFRMIRRLYTDKDF